MSRLFSLDFTNFVQHDDYYLRGTNILMVDVNKYIVSRRCEKDVVVNNSSTIAFI